MKTKNCSMDPKKSAKVNIYDEGRLCNEFKMLRGMKLPANPKLLPMANGFLEIMHGRSDSKVKVEKKKIMGYQGSLISIYVIEPKGVEKNSVCLLDIHGGGFMMKGSPAHFARAKEYAYKLKCTVIFPDYRLIPKNPYPISVEDCFCTYEWVVKHARELKIDVNKIAVLGDSAGGSLAVATTMMARDRGLPVPCFQMLLYPVLDKRMETESMKLYTDTPVWDARLTRLMWELYLKGQNEITSEYASPAEIKDLSNMPATYIEVAEFDCLRDEGISFARKLKDSGIDVELHMVFGSVHGYDVLMKGKIVKRMMRRRIEVLRKVLDIMSE